MKHLLLALILLTVAAVPQLHAADQAKPKIRSITGFVTIDAKSYASQLEEAVTFLNRVRDAGKAAGYDVSGIRISTQPFPDYTRGLSHADALAVLRGISELAVTLRVNPNIGPAMGKKAGEMTEFNGAHSNAMIQPLPGSPRK